LWGGRTTASSRRQHVHQIEQGNGIRVLPQGITLVSKVNDKSPTVGITAVPDSLDIHHAVDVINRVNDSVIADPNAIL
jgi:hypothetical protein